MNNVILMGRLTRPVEIRQTSTGGALADFTIAVDRGGKDKGADFVPCRAFNKTADMIEQYFGKGDMIAVSGRLNVNAYKDKDGNNKTFTSVNVDRFYFCGSKRETAAEPTEASTPAQNSPDYGFVMVPDMDLEGLPFE